MQSIETSDVASRHEYELVYTYDENGNPQSVEKKDTLCYKETYTLDSDGFILSGEYEGKWASLREGYIQLSEIVYNEQEDEVI